MSGRRRAELDGLRGVAVVLVVAAHALSRAVGEDGLLAKVLLVPAIGGIGVTVFFVLSGYLITSILHREHTRTGRIRLGNFYLRRLLRIVPAFYVMVATVAVLGAVGLVAVGPGQVASAAAFVWDYSPAANGWWLGHSWSLSIEEQFYLLWPVGLLLMGARRACRFAVATLLATPVVRVLSYLLLPGGHSHAWMMFHARSDALLLGCFLALAPSAYPAVWARLERLAQLRRTEVTAVLVLVASSVLEGQLGGYWVMPFGYSLDALAAGALLTVVVARTAPSTLTRAVRWRPLVALGLVSYSLYLWQQLFLPPRGTPALPHVDSGSLAVPTALAAAVLSYLLVEKPFLALKDRRQRRVVPLGPTAALGGAAGLDGPAAPATSGGPV